MCLFFQISFDCTKMYCLIVRVSYYISLCCIKGMFWFFNNMLKASQCLLDQQNIFYLTVLLDLGCFAVHFEENAASPKFYPKIILLMSSSLKALTKYIDIIPYPAFQHLIHAISKIQSFYFPTKIFIILSYAQF